MDREVLRPYLRRLIILSVGTFVVVFVMLEIFFLFQKETSDRPPQVVELTIPAGTAARIDAGEAVPSIPEELVFVLGDELLVNNEDVAGHELGPLLIPPGSSASLQMDSAENYSVTCSFLPSRYLGLDVREPFTWEIRLIGLGAATPVTIVLLFLYSLIVFPMNTPKDKSFSV